MMRRMTTGVAAVLTASLAGATLAASAPRTMMFNLTTVTDAQGMHVTVQGKVWVKGQKARFETNNPMSGPMVVLVNGSRVHQLFPQRKQAMVSTIETGKDGPKNPWDFMIANVNQLTRGAKKTGQQNLDGYACDIYQATRTEQGRTTTLKAWITRTTKPRLPLKVENTLQVKRPNVTVRQTQSTRITGLKIGSPISDRLFDVPSGYKIVQAETPGALGIPGAPGMGRPGMRP